MKILVIDIGGTNVKIWMPGGVELLKYPTGPSYSPNSLVEQVRDLIRPDSVDRVSLGFPGDIISGRPAAEPYNLAPGWVGFDFAKALDRPVRVMNDACMQALGSYEGGTMLYLGLGTSVGTTLIADRKIVPLALGHLPFKRATLEAYLSRAGLAERGRRRWTRAVIDAATMFKDAFKADYVMLGGGNAKKLREVPEGCRRGGNHNAYHGGVRMWDDAAEAAPPLAVFPQSRAAGQ